jgi:hypothetical protein
MTRKRVVLEGDTSPTGEPGAFYIGVVGHRNIIRPDTAHVVSIEDIPDPVKVGDVLTTVEQLKALPANAVVVSASGVWTGANGYWMRAGWQSRYVSESVMLPAKYLHDGSPVQS